MISPPSRTEQVRQLRAVVDAAVGLLPTAEAVVRACTADGPVPASAARDGDETSAAFTRLLDELAALGLERRCGHAARK